MSSRSLSHLLRLRRVLTQLQRCKTRDSSFLTLRQTSSATTNSKDKKTFSTAPQSYPDWEKAVSDAEKLFDYPTSVLLQSLLSDEMANITGHLKKLVGTSHPLISTAKRLMHSKQNMQMRGLVVLLVSKAVPYVNTEELTEQDRASGVSHKQRTIAEVTEIIHLAYLLHNGTYNISEGQFEGSSLEDVERGNKTAVLAGDYLLANALVILGTLRDHRVLELYSNAVRSIAESAFVCSENIRGTPLPAPGVGIHDWEEKHFLAGGNLLGNSCKSAVLLSGHDEDLQEKGFELGKALALAWQAHFDLEPFIDLYKCIPGNPFDLISSPVIFHLSQEPNFLQEFSKIHHTLDSSDFKEIHGCILAGNGVEKTKELCLRHTEAALQVLHSAFEPSDARSALSNIISSLRIH